MEKKTYSKEEFQAMVADLESEFMNLMKSEQEAAQLLAKSEEEAKEEEKKEESKEESKAEAKESEEKKDEPKAEEKKDEEKKEEDDEAHGYDDEDMEEMRKMYSSMSKGELKAHKDAVEKCYMAKCGEMTQMAKSEESSQKQPEVKAEEQKSSEESTLLKSELESIKKENEELKKNIEGLVAAINTYVTKKQAPARKAITDIEFVKKSEEGSQERQLTKSEIDSILAKKAQDPKTSAQDRAAINSFYLTNAGVDKIAHLLKQ
jgi:hypothetical protein